MGGASHRMWHASTPKPNTQTPAAADRLRLTAGGVEGEGQGEDAPLRDVHPVHQRAVPRLLLRVPPWWLV